MKVNRSFSVFGTLAAVLAVYFTLPNSEDLPKDHWVFKVPRTVVNPLNTVFKVRIRFRLLKQLLRKLYINFISSIAKQIQISRLFLARFDFFKWIQIRRTFGHYRGRIHFNTT